MFRYLGLLVGLALTLSSILPTGEIHIAKAERIVSYLGYGEATTMAWSPNGEYLAIASRYDIWIYDDELNEIDYVPIESTYSMAWSSSNSKLAITVTNPDGYLGQAIIWDMPSDSFSPAFDYNFFTWHPQQDILALEGTDNKLAIVDTDGSLLPIELPDQLGIWDIQWSTDGEQLSITSSNNGLHIWNLAQKEMTNFYAETSTYGETHWLADNQFLAIISGSGSSNISSYLFNVAEQTMTRTNDFNENPRQRGVFSPNGSSIAFSFDDPARIGIINSMTGGMTIWETGQKYINEFAWSSDGQWIATSSRKKNVQVWDINTQQLVYTLETKELAQIFWHPTQPLLTLITANQLIELWDIPKQTRLHTVHTFNNMPLQVNWSRDGLYLIVASGESPANTINRIQVWDVQTGKLVEAVERSWVAEYPLAWQPVPNNYGNLLEDIDIFWSRDGQRYVTDDDGITQVWRVGQIESIRTLPDVTCVKSISASGRLLQTCDGIIWDLDTGQITLTLTNRRVAWHPSRDQFAVFEDDNGAKHTFVIAVKDGFTGETVETWLMSNIIAGFDLAFYPIEVQNFMWSPDGSQFFWSAYVYHSGYIYTLFDVSTHVATSGEYPMSDAAWRSIGNADMAGYVYRDGQALMQLRELATWRVLDEIEIPSVYQWDNLVSQLEWSPDGYYLAIGHIEGRIYIWDLDSRCIESCG